ncbi:MAG: seryl-tRNA synthetase [Sphingobacteriales bacterium]|jgi:seryl-tRNA synthetase
MLQVNFIRENKDAVINGLKKRNLDASSLIEEVIAIDDSRKKCQSEADTVSAEANTIAKLIGQMMKEGKKDEAEIAKAKTAELKASQKEFSSKLSEIEDSLRSKLLAIPNVPHESVPAGNSENDNELIFQEGEIPTNTEDFLPHWELTKKYSLIDFELGVKLTGAGFPVYTGKGAKLQRALINFFLDEADKAGYREVQPPILVNEESGYGTGQLPDKDGQMYFVNEDKLYLIPTAEVPVTNIYRDVIVDESELPIKNTAYTPCFRREAGSYGKDVRGLNRLHQFDKVEVVQITHPDNSYSTLDTMCEYVEGLLRKLELPFRKLRLCGGDLGFTAALTFDMEVYSSAQNRWLEVSSISNFETYQANRLKLRIKDKDNKKQLAHSLNGSALALPRIVAALLENNQCPEGIKIPKALQNYTGFAIVN